MHRRRMSFLQVRDAFNWAEGSGKDHRQRQLTGLVQITE